MAFIDLDTERSLITVVSDYRERDRIKEVPGTRWDTEAKLWTAPLSWTSCVTLRGVFGDDLEVSQALSDWAWDHYNTTVTALDEVRTALEFDPLVDSEPSLYPFQRAGVRFLEVAGQALLADEMGSGKTVQLARVLARLPESLPALVVAPNSMKYKWAEELEKWVPGIRPVVVGGSAAKRRQQIAQITEGTADVLIINWEGLRFHSKLKAFGNKRLTDAQSKSKELNEIEFRTVIADEAHKAKDPNAQQTQALKAVGDKATYRFAATGTPVANHPGDLWSILNFVSPQDFPAKTKYIDRYCTVSWNPFGGVDILGIRPDTAEELYQILNTRMIRRTKDVVLPYLPEKTYSTRVLPMPDKQAKTYRQMAERMLAELDSGDLTAATNPLALLTRLSQFACAHATLVDDRVVLQDPSNKLDAMMEIIEEAEGASIVVAAESRQLIELAEKRLSAAGITYGSIHGMVDVQTRAQSVTAFQEGKLQIMLVTMGAGGEGITLTRAQTMIFLQRSYSMVKNRQMEDRIHRPGQDGNKVEIIDLVSEGTIEAAKLAVLDEKTDRLEEVVRDDELRALLRYR